MSEFENKTLELLDEVLLKDEEAKSFIFRLFKDVVRVWDNVWDGDVSYTKEEVDNAFATILFGFKENIFYNTYRPILDAQMFLAWNAWKDSNELKESEDLNEQKLAWVLKDYCNDIIILCAYLLGGHQHARRSSLKLRRHFLSLHI